MSVYTVVKRVMILEPTVQNTLLHQKGHLNLTYTESTVEVCYAWIGEWISIWLCGKFRCTHTSNFVTSAPNKSKKPHWSLTRVSDSPEQPIKKHFRGKIPKISSALGGISLNLVLILMILKKSKAVLIAFPLTHWWWNMLWLCGR